jgi:hypothetical protein
MNRRALPAALAAATCLTVAACGSGGGDKSAAASSTATPTTSPAATSSSSAPTTATVAPNVGSSALSLDAWREGTDIRTRIRSVTQARDASLPSYLVGDTSAEGAVALVEVCVRESASAPFQGEVFDLFSARDGNGGQYTRASSSWDAWPPRPQFPTEVDLRPGDCASGSVLFSVPRDVRLASIALTNGSQKVAEWLVG